jgi:predicted Zn-ribbon and HTH transcriptional regulator
LSSQTLRQRIMSSLLSAEMDAREISQAIGIPEKEVYRHLAHVARSASGGGRQLKVRPSECLQCGYVFTHRRRLNRPGRCPRCKQSRLRPPRFRVV